MVLFIVINQNHLRFLRAFDVCKRNTGTSFVVVFCEWQSIALLMVLVIVLSLAPYQQGSSISMTTSPFCNEHLSYFLAQRAVGPFGHDVSQPWLSRARYPLLLKFAQSLRLLLLLLPGLGFLWKRWTLTHSSCVSFWVVFLCVDTVSSGLIKCIAVVDVDSIF